VLFGADAGRGGITAPGHDRYVALRAGRGTLVVRIDRSGGRVAARRWLRERVVVPTAALDLAPTGLSADGGTLVLASPRIGDPESWSVFAVLDARRLSLRRTVRLRGDFALHAVSPDGRTLFLTETPFSHNPDRFAVRAYDVTRGQLLAEPVLDRARGWPTARATSRDGRWAYTLYQGRRVVVHALDAQRGVMARARLPQLAAELVGRLRLKVHPDGMGVHRTDGGLPLVLVDPGV
jgi:hypothetical protein